MKTPLALTLLALGFLPVFADQADVYYRQGMAAVGRGDADAARTAFNQALEARPNHAHARYQLNQLRNNRGEMVAKQRAAKFAAVRIPEIRLSDVSLSDALLALGLMIETETTKEDDSNPFLPNFVVKDPSGKFSDREINLQLKGVPAKVALDYILEQAGATVRYDQHATVVRPAG